MKNMGVHKDKFIVRHYHKRQIEVEGHKRKLKDYLRGNELGDCLSNNQPQSAGNYKATMAISYIISSFGDYKWQPGKKRTRRRALLERGDQKSPAE